MRFTLTYDGLLPSRGGAEVKQQIREALHPQLRELWSHQPLADHRPEFLVEPGPLNVLKHVGNHVFAPLVSTNLHMLAELHIEILRPEPPGSIVTNQGDIDNRLKTLFDALRAPNVAQEIKTNASPSAVANPTFTLLEDDRLITGVTVKTDRLLAPLDTDPNYTRLTIGVTARPSRILWGTLDLAG